MKILLKEIFKNIKEASLIKKIFSVLIVALYIFILVICFKKVDVEVATPGVINNPLSSATIDTENENSYIGTIGIYTYKRISLIQYWLAKGDNEMALYDINKNTDLSSKEEQNQGIIMKDNSVISALIVAYRAASLIDDSITISEEDLYLGVTVSAIYSYSDTDLKVGDLITKVNGESFNNLQEFNELCSKTKNERDYIQFSVEREGKDKEIECYAKIKEVENSNGEKYKAIGISVDSTYAAPLTTPTYTINNDHTSIGPSGGAMTALAFYNKLVSFDVTRGKKVVGTGTIDADGVLGQIGGVEQKIVTAKNYGIDIFFVDALDYDDAKAAYDLYDCKFELVSVEKFSDILDYLETIEMEEE